MRSRIDRLQRLSTLVRSLDAPGPENDEVRVRRGRLGVRDHSCVACHSPCLVEQNSLFSLSGPVLWHFARRHLRRFA